MDYVISFIIIFCISYLKEGIYHFNNSTIQWRLVYLLTASFVSFFCSSQWGFLNHPIYTSSPSHACFLIASHALLKTLVMIALKDLTAAKSNAPPATTKLHALTVRPAISWTKVLSCANSLTLVLRLAVSNARGAPALHVSMAIFWTLRLTNARSVPLCVRSAQKLESACTVYNLTTWTLTTNVKYAI